MGEREPSPYRAEKIAQGVGKEIRVNGILYRYWDKGSGPALLALHGFGGSAYDWHLHFDGLVEAGFRVIVPDLPGSGYTDRPEDLDYSLPGLVRCIIDFADALELDRFHLVGSSHGGGLALRIAVEHPHRVNRMMVFDAASMDQKMPRHVRILRWPILSRLAIRIPPRTFLLTRLMKEIFHDPGKIVPEDISEYAYELAFPGGDQAMEKIARALDMEEVRQYSARFCKINSPTLIFWGENDSIIPFTVGQALHKAIPGSEFRPFPECGHCPHMEYPEETLREMIAFLKKTGNIMSDTPVSPPEKGKSHLNSTENSV